MTSLKLRDIFSSVTFLLLGSLVFFAFNQYSIRYINWFDSGDMPKQLFVFFMVSSVLWLLFKGLKELMLLFAKKVNAHCLITTVFIGIFALYYGFALLRYIWQLNENQLCTSRTTAVLSTILVLEILVTFFYDFHKRLTNDQDNQ